MLDLELVQVPFQWIPELMVTNQRKIYYTIPSLLNKAPPNFGSSAAFSCQICQALRYQNRSKCLVWHYINIDAMHYTKVQTIWFSSGILAHMHKTEIEV